jgi:hypothetical protein
MRRLQLIALVAFAGAMCGTAEATPTPPGVQAEAKALLGQMGALDLALVPTRVPPHYAFESYSITGDPPGLNVSFADQRLIASSTKTHEHEISFDTSYLARGRACSAQAKRNLRVAGTTIYVAGTTVWRCVKAQRGRVVKEAASGRASTGALALVVASARPAG